MDDNTNATYPDVELVAGSDYTAQERAALVTYQLARGARLSTAEIAERAGFRSKQGVYDMMDKLSRVTPISVDRGRWQMND